jgi:hypothetical protein
MGDIVTKHIGENAVHVSGTKSSPSPVTNNGMNRHPLRLDAYHTGYSILDSCVYPSSMHNSPLNTH